MTDSVIDEAVESEEVDEEAEESAEEQEPGTDSEEFDEDEELEDDEEPEEMYEMNFGSEKLSVPKSQLPEEVAQKLQSYADGIEASSTKKFMAIAEERKEIEAQRKTYEKLSQLNGEALSLFGQGQAIAQEVAALEREDLNALWQSNPDEARRKSDLLNQRRAQKEQYLYALAQYDQAMKQEEDAETARRMERGKELVDEAIPGFSTKEAQRVIDYAVKKGVPKEEAEKWPLNPYAAITSYQAMLYEEMQAKAKTQSKKKPVQPVKPSGSKGGGPKKDPSRQAMSTEDYIKWYNKKRRKRAG